MKKGTYHTEQSLKKMGGRIPWNKGKTGIKTNEVGHAVSEETRKKISTTLKERFKDKKNHPMFNKHHSEETKKKLKGSWDYKKHFTEETKRKMSETAKKKGFGKWMKGKKLTKEHVKNILKAQRGQPFSGKPTSIEKKLYEELKARGILFERQRLIGGRFVVDAYIPSLNLVIEADGDYWHSLPENIKRDKNKNSYLKKHGYNLLRLTGTEIRNDSFMEKLDEEVN